MKKAKQFLTWLFLPFILAMYELAENKFTKQMRYDHQAIREAQRKCLEVITAPSVKVKNDKGQICDERNPYWVNPLNVSMPIKLVQEIPWVNTTQNNIFDFSITAPNQVPGVNNNVILGQKNVFCCYGIQILFSEHQANGVGGLTSANAIYRSFGNTVNDDALYNSLISIRFEQSTLVDRVNGQDFRDVPNVVTEFNSNDGMLLINPIRIVPGDLGIFSMFINLLNPIATLTITPNMFISARLVGAFGQASA